MSKIYLDSVCGCGCGCSCNIWIAKYQVTEKSVIEKIILLNALVPISEKSAIMISTPITVDEAKMLVNRAQSLESYIGHEVTAKLLSQIFGKEISVNRGMYTPENYDMAVVVRLKKRLEKPEDVKSIKPDDIELLLVRYYTKVDIVEYK